MGAGLILDDLCVVVGIVVLWAANGFEADLWGELKTVKPGQFLSRSEGVVGLVVIAAFVGIFYLFLKHARASGS